MIGLYSNLVRKGCGTSLQAWDQEQELVWWNNFQACVAAARAFSLTTLVRVAEQCGSSCRVVDSNVA